MAKTIRKRKSNNLKKKRFSKKQNGGAARYPSIRMTQRISSRNNNSNSANIQKYIASINTALGCLELPKIKQALSFYIPNLLGINDTQGKFNKNCFTFEYLVPDKNLDDAILADPYKWYLETTGQTASNFQPITNIINLRVPQYIAIVMGMVKDLLLVLCMNRMPGLNVKDIERKPSNTGKTSLTPDSNGRQNNEISRKLRDKTNAEMVSLSANAKILLINIEILIGGNIPYVLFTEIVFQYIMFFSTGNILPPDPDSPCGKLKIKYDEIVNSPYIFLPSFKQLDFYKVIDLCKAPIVNFRLINTRRLVHTGYAYPCIETFHDIFHARQTHHNLVDTGNLRMLFDTRNATFTRIQNLYHYPKSLVEQPMEEKIKYQNCCILFILIHEIALGVAGEGYSFPAFYTEPYTVSGLIQNLVELKNRLDGGNGDRLYANHIVPNFDSFKRPGANHIVANLSTKKGFIDSIDFLTRTLSPYL